MGRSKAIRAQSRRVTLARLATAALATAALATACSRPSPSPATVPATVSGAAETPTSEARPPGSLPPALAASGLRRHCVIGERAPAANRETRYDFEDIVIEPASFGPRIADKPRVGIPVVLAEVAPAVNERRDRLTECYRWARHARPWLQGLVSVDLELDIWGIADEIAVDAEMANGEELAKCVQDMLAGVAIDRYTLRRARLRFPLLFEVSGQRLPESRPPRPLPVSEESSIPHDMCIVAPAKPEVDVVSSSYPLLAVDDFSREQAEREAEDKRREAQRQALEQWTMDGEVGPQPSISPPPTVVIHGDVVCSCGLDKRYVLAGLRENLGAYRQCFEDAADGGVKPPGRVHVAGAIDAGGTVTARASSDWTGDEAVVECLRRAVEEVWFQPPLRGHRHGTIRFTFDFRLAAPPPASRAPPVGDSPTIEALEGAARRALDRGDGEQAERRYAALLESAPGQASTCAWHLGILEARLLSAPWIDYNVMAAARDLIDFVTGHADEATTGPCLRSAAPTLMRLATEPHNRGLRRGLLGLIEVAASRYLELVDIASSNALGDADELWFFLGEALWVLGRYEEAASAYAQVLDIDPSGKYFKESELALLQCRDRVLRLRQGGALYP